MAENESGGIVFLPVPRSVQKQAEDAHSRGRHEHEDERGPEKEFSIDPAVPIPAEIPPGKDGFTPDELTMEMILSGMLKIIAGFDGKISSGFFPDGSSPADIKPEWMDYYRRFVLAVRPGIFNEFNEAAILKTKNGDIDTALEILAALGGLFPGSPVVLLNRALALEEKAGVLDAAGKNAEAEAAVRAAEAAYDAVLAMDPPFPNAFFNAAYFRLKHHDFAGAEECFSAYVSFAEEGVSGVDDEKRENAEKALVEIKERFLSDENFRKARELVRNGKEEEALDRIRGFLENHPEVWNGWFILGWALRRLERWSDGKLALKKAVELGGTNSDVRNELAICLMELADYPGAKKELEAALREEPENIKIISNLGVLAMKRGDK
ncbi:MAG: tetratricopeptide repeat protein, partial [Treponema sp.]|nr:tetratricopeptide repeat protein [Treponema sp.]